MSSVITSPLIAGVMNWGTWGVNFSTKEISKYISELFDLGISAFDHADIYGDYEEEERFGKAFIKTNISREQVQLISKCGIRLLSKKHPEDYIKHYNLSKKHIIASAEKSLQNLRTDYLDVLLLHRPSVLLDPNEVAEAFQQLQKDGKVLHFGVSNFNPSQFDLLNHYFPLVTNQVQASVAHLNPFLDGTFDQAMEHKVRPTIWSPFAGGKIFKNDESSKLSGVISTCNELSLTTGYGFDQILLAFVMKHPSKPIPVIGTTKIERFKTALKATELKLSTQEWFEIWSSAIGNEVA